MVDKITAHSLDIELPSDQKAKNISIRKVEVDTILWLLCVPHHSAVLRPWAKLFALLYDVDIILVLQL